MRQKYRHANSVVNDGIGTEPGNSPCKGCGFPERKEHKGYKNESWCFSGLNLQVDRKRNTLSNVQVKRMSQNSYTLAASKQAPVHQSWMWANERISLPHGPSQGLGERSAKACKGHKCPIWEVGLREQAKQTEDESEQRCQDQRWRGKREAEEASHDLYICI